MTSHSTHYQLARHYIETHQFTLASHYIQALTKESLDDCHYLWALYFRELGDFDQAITFNKRVEDRNRADLLLGLLLLQSNNPEGWAFYHKRHHVQGADENNWRNHPGYWQGNIVNDGTLLILWEQGIGDNIMACRYFSLLKKHYGFTRVLYNASRYCHRLMNSLGDCEVIDEGNAAFTHVCYIMDLIMYMDSPTGGAISPAHFSLPPIRKRIQHTNKPNIGIVWSGNPKHTHDNLRSIPFDEFRQLFLCESLVFHALQYGEAAKDFHDVPPHCQALFPHIHSVDDTADFVRQMDLVITVDTMTAHLGGSLQIPTWLLCPKVADWRWGQSGNTTPWYPRITIFRQDKLDCWHAALKRVRQALEDKFQDTQEINVSA